MLVMLAVVAASLTTTFTRRHVTLVLVLSSAGFALAVAYAFYGAPNVALVAVLVETMVTLLVVATLKLIPTASCTARRSYHFRGGAAMSSSR